ncbi:MAG: acyltransferase, partial [Bacteroidales bacterium]|nr:acyltransferase [Bacteroidales bacterium]
LYGEKVYFCRLIIQITMTVSDSWNILCSLPKTLRFNLHYFPLKTALKLPVFVSRRTYLRELHGEVVLPEQVETAMVKIGFGDVGHYDRKRSRGIWQVSGTVRFEGKAGIGHGSKLSVRGHLNIGADFNMTAESTIVCADNITFGNDCLVGWDVLVMDTDEHPLYDKKGERLNPNRPIVVGDHVWIGCKCVLLKGAEVPDNTVVAAGTLLKSAFEGENQVIGGNPPAVLKQEVRWEHS